MRIRNLKTNRCTAVRRGVFRYRGYNPSPCRDAFCFARGRREILAPARDFFAMSPPLPLASAASGGAGDFDFFIGTWRVSHRRLRARLAGSQTWDEFAGTATAWKMLGGFGDIDDHVLEFPGGPYRAVSLRSYDAAQRQWSIWWLDSRHPGQLDPPVRGAFADGVGTFYADDVFEDRAIRVRFLWTGTASAAPHWEQAFSADDSKTWETNWEMDFARAT